MSEAVQSVRDRARAKAMANRQKSAPVEFEGEKFVVKQPTGADYEAVGDSKGIRATAILLSRTVWVCDESGAPLQKLWEPGDIDAIVEMPISDPLLDALLKALNGLTNAAKLQEDAKKSP